MIRFIKRILKVLLFLIGAMFIMHTGMSRQPPSWTWMHDIGGFFFGWILVWLAFKWADYDSMRRIEENWRRLERGESYIE